MSREGRQYQAANGSKIANFGQTEAEFRTLEGHTCKLLFQVADVKRVLVGVTPLTRTGHEVHLGADSGELVHTASGRRIALPRKGGVYTLPMFFLVKDDTQVQQPQQQQQPRPDTPRASAAVFARPGP